MDFSILCLALGFKNTLPLACQYYHSTIAWHSAMYCQAGGIALRRENADWVEAGAPKTNPHLMTCVLFDARCTAKAAEVVCGEPWWNKADA